ncbi:UDP-glucose--hexose-1-phosphate uridylyltransferase [Ruminiclostridium hungatei]|nr:UDP-glucose--hexose-1-phosphate uridylyltransferase [Ruminiclostridium hungatei]
MQKEVIEPEGNMGINPAYEIERLLLFGREHGLTGKLDAVIARNQLLAVLQIQEPYTGEIEAEALKYPTGILNRLVAYAQAAGLCDKGSYTAGELFDTKLMGFLMPRQAEIESQFRRLRESKSVEAATDYFYELCTASNYIRTAAVEKNIVWTANTRYGGLEITVNLSKPEKDPAEIVRERLQPQSGYPKCMLCLENIGYPGRSNFPARQTHRIIPVTLCGEQWYLQYSPYLYYREHCIVFSERHEPMKISEMTFSMLLDFVRQFPHYICGSNADLPIVGGSILSHNHFQGGKHLFPMQKAPVIRRFRSEEFKGVDIAIVKWPLSVIRVAGNDPEELSGFCSKVLSEWRQYSDSSVEVLAASLADNSLVPHNTITPIARLNEAGKYELDLVLRNNRTTCEYPEGLFHPHREIHHIKKENIGLIEVMGLAILPGRLKAELESVREILCGRTEISGSIREDALLFKHSRWIAELTAKYKLPVGEAEAEKLLRQETGKKFETCLEHAGVFKQTREGLKAFERFIKTLGCR